MFELWVIFAFIAMLLNVGKVISLKRYCQNIQPTHLIFYSRLFPAIILLLPTYISDFEITDISLFVFATFIAVVLTLFASIFYICSSSFLQKSSRLHYQIDILIHHKPYQLHYRSLTLM